MITDYTHFIKEVYDVKNEMTELVFQTMQEEGVLPVDNKSELFSKDSDRVFAVPMD